MKPLLKHITIFIFSLTMFNCSNDDTEDIPTPQSENIRLAEFSIGVSEYSITYNEDNFISLFDSSTESNYPRAVIYNAENQVIQFDRYSYTYNTQGRISRITEPDNSSYVNQQTSIVYNNDGLVAIQNLRFTGATSGTTTFITRTFEYNSSNQLISITEDNRSYVTRELFTYDSRGNIVQLIRQTSSDGINFSDTRTTNYIYDNKKNPGIDVLNSLTSASNFSYYYLYNIHTLDLGNYAFFRLVYYSTNNIISSHSTYSTGQSNRTYNYVYNDEDYPTAVEIHYSYSDGSEYDVYKTWTYETY